MERKGKDKEVQEKDGAQRCAPHLSRAAVYYRRGSNENENNEG